MDNTYRVFERQSPELGNMTELRLIGLILRLLVKSNVNMVDKTELMSELQEYIKISESELDDVLRGTMLGKMGILAVESFQDKVLRVGVFWKNALKKSQH